MSPAAAEQAVGVLGGTFDPVHLGHLRVAEHVRTTLSLARLLLLPTARPPHKQTDSLSATRHREAMLRLALGDREALELCPLEFDADEVAYTIDTLRALRDGTPPCLPLFVLGMDSLLLIDTWRDYRQLLREFDLAVIDRPTSELDRVHTRLIPDAADRIVRILPGAGGAARVAELHPGRGGRIFHLPVAPIAISSSAIRERAARGLSLTGLVPPAVAEYIQSTSLYRQEDAR